MTKLDRRQLGKGLASGLAAGLLGTRGALTQATSNSGTVADMRGNWGMVMPGVWKATIGKPEPITPVQSRLVAPDTTGLAAMTQVTQPPLPRVSGTIAVRGTSVALPLQPNEDMYGFGLQFFSLQHRAKKLVTRVNADPRFDTGDSHAPVPFYVTNKGYGILIDTARYATFYCGEARDKPEAPAKLTDGGIVPTTTTDLYAKKLADTQPATVLVDIPGAQGVEVYLFAGPTMLEAVRRYNLFSGGGVNPPEWGLGFWYRTQSNASDKDVIQQMQEFRDRKIPCDVIGLEGGWQSHSYSCTFAFKKELFPNPPGFVKEMQARDLHVNLWEHGFTHPASELFTPLLPLSGDKGVWGGLVPDFQDAKARKVFGDFHGRTLLEIGVDGFKLDECDNSDYTGGWSFPELSRFPSGVDGEQMHSLFGLRYQRALWDQFQQRSRPTYGLVRSSGALASPYPFVLYSDLYDHRQFVRALVNSGFSGLLWCPEVRDAPKGEEELIRRLQVVVFSPLAMINGWYIKNPPWKQMDRKKNNANDLAPNWERLETRCREIIGWRMQIVPYLRSAFSQYAVDGTPPFRALVLDWPEVPAMASVDDAWMVGDRMLVVPMFAGEASRSITMPPGIWYNFWTGAKVAGGAKLQLNGSEPNIPVFIKDGSVLPVATITNSTAAKESRELTVRVYGDGQMPFHLDMPDGGSLKLSWDAGSGKGSMQQSGSHSYSVVKWQKA